MNEPWRKSAVFRAKEIDFNSLKKTYEVLTLLPLQYNTPINDPSSPAIRKNIQSFLLFIYLN